MRVRGRLAVLTGLLVVLAVATGRAAPAPPRLEAPRLTVPLGESRSVAFKAASLPSLAVVDPEVADARLQGSRVVVRGLSAGNTVVLLDFPPSHRLELAVAVRTPAARFPDRLTVSLTGSQVGDTVLGQAVQATLDSCLAPRARLRWSSRYVGGKLVLDVAADGPQLLPASASMPLEVTLQQLPFTSARALLVSNRPELVVGPGVLLDRPLPPGPSRMLFHHRGSPEYPDQELEVALRNVNASPARVRVAMIALGPSQDEIYVGHLAGSRFVTLQQKGQSFIVRIPPGGEVCLDRRALRGGLTDSGMGWLEPLDNAQVRLLVRAVEPGSVDPPDYEAPDPGTGNRTARGVFPPALDLCYAHHAGGPFTFIPLGDQPYGVDASTGESNYGNFGVVYRVRVELSNPTAEVRRAWVDFVPRAGPARGSLFVDGERLETEMGNSAQELRLGTWELAPGESREVWIETFPQSGSNYPVMLVVKSDYSNGAVPAAPRPEATPSESRYLY